MNAYIIIFYLFAMQGPICNESQIVLDKMKSCAKGTALILFILFLYLAFVVIEFHFLFHFQKQESVSSLFIFLVVLLKICIIKLFDLI